MWNYFSLCVFVLQLVWSSDLSSQPISFQACSR
jgi:hypothetical protein